MTDSIKRTYINANEELIVRGKLTVEGEFVQLDTTTVESQTLFSGDSLVINSDGDGATASLVLQSTDSNAVISYTEGGSISFSEAIAVSGDIEANIIGNVTGTVSDISNHTTSDLSEGTNLYFTTTRARTAISAGTGISYDSANGVLSIGQDVGTSANVNFDNITANTINIGTASAGDIEANVIGHVKADNGTVVLANGTDGTDAVFTGNVVGDVSGNVVGDVTGNLTGNVTGQVSDISNHTTTDLSEGTNLYYTTSRVRGDLSAAGDIDYDSANGVFSVTTYKSGDFDTDFAAKTTDDLSEGNSSLYYTDGRVDAHLVGGDGIDYSNGDISVDSTVARTTGTTFTNDVEIQGNLNVTANINSRTQTDLFVEDNSITLANGSVSNVDAQIFVDGNYSNKPNIRWDASSQTWEFSNDGVTYHLMPRTTEDLPEQINLYYTDARANAAMDAYLASITANVDSVNGETGVVTLDTDDISEGSNLYYTDARVDAHLSGNTGINYVAGEISVDGTVVRTLGDHELEGELSFAANAALKIPTTELLEENAIYASGSEVFAYVGGISRKLTPAVDVGDIETVGASGVEIYAGTRTEVVSNANVTVAGIRRLESGNSVLITEASNVITVNANISSIRERFGAEKTAGLGNLTYNNSTGVFSYTGVTSTEIRSQFSNTGLITYNTSTGEIGTTADLYASWTVETESANTHAITSGSTLRILGGTNITVENDGANITIRNDNDADITAVIAGTGLTGGGVAGNVTLNVDMTQFNTDDLAEGNTNLYYTDVRANSAIDERVDTAYVNALGISASNVVYNNASSAIESVNVQDAITELSDNKLDVTALTGAVTFFATSANSDITNYNRLVTTTSDADFDTTPVDISTGTFSGANVLIAQLASDTGVLSSNTTSINIVTYGDVRRETGNENDGAEFFFEVHKRDSDDNETLLATSSATRTVDQEVYQQFFATALIPDTGFTEDDRVVLKFYGTVTRGSGNRSYSFRFGGDKPVRTLFPVPVDVVVQNIAARNIDVDTGAFDGILNPADIDVQRALESLDQVDTDVVPEGNTNLYYTDGRARDSVSLTQTPPANGNVFAVANISYSNNTGVFATTTISEADVRDLFSATSPLSYDANTGEFSITEVGDISSVTAGNGLVGGGTSGAVTLDVGAGTGIIVDTDNISVDMSVFSTDDLSEGSNLYYTVERARVAVSADTSTGIDYNVSTGQFFLSSVPNDSISNSSITVNGVEFNLGDTNTVTANTTQTLTRGTYLTGSDFDGGTATTWAVDASTTNVANKVVARDANGSFAANVVTATATQAQYADLAENYLADREYEPGTVLIIGGDAEVTTTDVHCDTRVAGVVSTDPAHLMNSKLKGKKVVALALRGRVPVKVRGPVHKGEVLVTCERAGYACVAQDPASVPACAIIGKALTSHASSGSGVVEVMV